MFGSVVTFSSVHAYLQRLADACTFDDQIVESVSPRQLCNLFQKILPKGATDAAILSKDIQHGAYPCERVSSLRRHTQI